MLHRTSTTGMPPGADGPGDEQVELDDEDHTEDVDEEVRQRRKEMAEAEVPDPDNIAE